MAEGGGLLNRYRVKSSIGGSNPPLSARYSPVFGSIFPFKIFKRSICKAQNSAFASMTAVALQAKKRSSSPEWEEERVELK